MLYFRGRSMTYAFVYDTNDSPFRYQSVISKTVVGFLFLGLLGKEVEFLVC